MKEKRKDPRERALRKFEHLIKDASANDLFHLMHFDKLRRQVYALSADEKSLDRGTSIEWPLVWMLTRFHRKHILMSRRRPGLMSVWNSLVHLERRLRWKTFFGLKKSEEKYVRVPNLPPRPFTGVPPPELDWWLAALRRNVMGLTINARSHALACRACNMTKLTRFCLNFSGIQR